MTATGVQNLKTVLQPKIAPSKVSLQWFHARKNTGLDSGAQGVLPAATVRQGEFKNRRKSRSRR